MSIDPNIKRKADDIRTKTYGSEVRESLASGLEAMSEDVVETKNRQDTVESQFQQVIDETTGKDVISAPEIIAARNGEPNLKSRLDKQHQQVTAQLEEMVQKAHKTVTVGSDGDVQTINEAITELSKGRSIYNPFGYRALIVLKSGFVMQEQILCDAIDLSHITIQSEDEEVVISRQHLTQAFSTITDPSIVAYPAFGARRNGKLPNIDVLFNMDDTGSNSWRVGVLLTDNSEGYVLPGKGVKNAGHYGAYVIHSSHLLAFRGNFDGAGDNGVGCFRGSFVNLRLGSAKNAGQHGLYLGSSSTVEALDADISGAKGYGAWVYNGGRLAIRGGKITDCGNTAVYAEHASWVSVGRADLSRSGNRGIHAFDGAVVEGHQITITDCINEAVHADDNAEVNLRDGLIENNGHSGATGKNAVESFNLSRVNLKATIVKNNGRNGLFAQFGGEINISTGQVIDNGDYGAWANRGGRIIANVTTTSGNGNTDFRVAYGSTIIASGTSGTLSQQENVTTLNGIIYK